MGIRGGRTVAPWWASWKWGRRAIGLGMLVFQGVVYWRTGETDLGWLGLTAACIGVVELREWERTREGEDEG